MDWNVANSREKIRLKENFTGLLKKYNGKIYLYTCKNALYNPNGQKSDICLDNFGTNIGQTLDNCHKCQWYEFRTIELRNP